MRFVSHTLFKPEIAGGKTTPVGRVPLFSHSKSTFARGKPKLWVLLALIIKVRLIFLNSSTAWGRGKIYSAVKTGKTVWCLPYQCLTAAILTSCPPGLTGICCLTLLPSPSTPNMHQRIWILYPPKTHKCPRGESWWNF